MGGRKIFYTYGKRQNTVLWKLWIHIQFGQKKWSKWQLFNF